MNPNIHEIEPELQGPLPRRVRERSYIVALQLWLTRIAGILLCFVCYLASRSLRDANDWLHDQQKTTGVVLSKAVYEGKTTTYQITLSYDMPQGSRNDVSTDVDDGFYNALNENGPILVYYRTTHPERWRLRPVTESSIDQLQSGWYFGIGWGTAIVACCLIGLKHYRNDRIALLRDGCAAIATVTQRKIATGSKGEKYRYLVYRWKDQRSTEHSKQIQVSEANYDRYPESSQFTVISPADDRFSSVPYFAITEAEVAG